MGSSHDRCALHPHRQLVGVCAPCLRDRLICLIKSIDRTYAFDGEDPDEEMHIRSTIFKIDQEPKLPPPLRMHPYPQERSSKSLQSTIKASAEMGLHSHGNLEDSLSLALQKVKHAHQQLRFVAQSSYHQGAVAAGPTGSLLFSSIANDTQGSLPASCHASASDMKAFLGGFDMPGKKTGSWFSISKAKSSVLSSPLPENANGGIGDKHRQQKSPQIMIFAGRKSASGAMGSSCNSYRQASMADLQAIAETNIGDAAIRVDRNEGSTYANANANPSWISSLFHRSRGYRFKSDVRQHVGGGGNTTYSSHESPKVSIDAGRLSLDGAKSNIKQIFHKIEARNKHQRVDCSPIRTCDCARKQDNDRAEDMLVASARSNTSVVKRVKHFAPASPSNVNTGMQYNNGNNDRFQSWGRAWNKTFSLLLGFRNHGRRSIHDPPHPGYVTPDHVSSMS